MNLCVQQFIGCGLCTSRSRFFPFFSFISLLRGTARRRVPFHAAEAESVPYLFFRSLGFVDSVKA